jgi:hypothetical protein
MRLLSLAPMILPQRSGRARFLLARGPKRKLQRCPQARLIVFEDETPFVQVRDRFGEG